MQLARALICLRTLIFLVARAAGSLARDLFASDFFFLPRAAAFLNAPTSHARCACASSIPPLSSRSIITSKGDADRPGRPNGSTRPRPPTLAPRWPVPAEREAPSAVSQWPTAQEKRKISRIRSCKNSPKAHVAPRQQGPPRSSQVSLLCFRRLVFLARALS